jgi:intracellular septation protein A
MIAEKFKYINLKIVLTILFTIFIVINDIYVIYLLQQDGKPLYMISGAITISIMFIIGQFVYLKYDYKTSKENRHLINMVMKDEFKNK